MLLFLGVAISFRWCGLPSRPPRKALDIRGNHSFSDVAFSIEEKNISKKLELGHWTHVSVLGWVAGRDTGVKCLFSFIVLRTLWLRVSSTV